MSKDSKAQQRATRQHPPTKIIVERHYVGTEKMETVFKRIAEEQITKKVKEIAENNANVRKGHVKENQERTPRKENAGQVYGYHRPIRLSERRERP